MEEDTYKFRSYNTLEHIEFHDGEIKKTELYNKNLFLYFDIIYILETHPDNDTDNFKEINNVMIRFEKTRMRKSQWHDMSKVFENAFEKQIKSGNTGAFVNINFDEVEVKDIDFLDAFNDLTVLSLAVTKKRKKYICKIDGVTIGNIHRSGMKIEFEYSDAYICFN